MKPTRSHDEDAALIAQIAKGEREAFKTLYRSYHKTLVRYGAGILAGDVEAAEDAVDEAFMSLWKTASQFRGDCSTLSWLRRLTRNKAIDYIRRRKDAEMTEEIETKAASQADDHSAETDLLQAERQSQIKDALGVLSPDHRDVIWQCYYEHRSVQDIAETMDIPENTVKTRLYHARKHLKELLLKRKVWP